MIDSIKKHPRLSWLITIIIAITIFYISTLQFPPGPPGKFSLKAPLYHFFAFFFLATFLNISIVKGKYKKLIVLALILTILYAISDEFHQLFVPNRAASLNDIFLDSFGALTATLIYTIRLNSKTSRIKSRTKKFRIAVRNFLV